MKLTKTSCTENDWAMSININLTKDGITNISATKQNTTPNGTQVTTETFNNYDITNKDTLQTQTYPQLSENQLCNECNKIDQCAQNQIPYYYQDLPQENVDHLKEYALACGLPITMFKKAQKEEKIITATKEPKMVRTASNDKYTSMTEQLQSVLQDPFHIDERLNAPSIKGNWEKVTTAQTIKEPDNMDKGIKPVRGGEKYDIHSDHKSAPGTNTISNPDSIEVLAKSEKEDTGKRLHREREEREASIKISHKAWEQDKIDSMSLPHALSKGTIFPTETMNAQSGLNSPRSQMGVYSDFNKDDIPTLTAGEKLKQTNDIRKSSIQRPQAEASEIKNKHQSTRTISDDFSTALENALNKCSKG